MKAIMNGITKKSEICRVVIFIALSILPTIFVIKGIVRLFNGELITFPFAILFFATPIIIIIGSFHFIRDNNISPGGKTFLCIIMIIALSVFTFFIVTFGTFKELHTYKNDKAEDKYQSVTFNECGEMPSLVDMGNYTNISYYNYQSHFILGSPSANTVVIKYNEEEYEKEKQELLLKYVFQTDPIRNTEPSATIDEYEFKMLSPDEYCNYYPKHVRFIATNDQAYEIIHIDFYDVELDYIESVEDFILTDCGFKYIKWSL